MAEYLVAFPKGLLAWTEFQGQCTFSIPATPFKSRESQCAPSKLGGRLRILFAFLLVDLLVFSGILSNSKGHFHMHCIYYAFDYCSQMLHNSVTPTFMFLKISRNQMSDKNSTNLYLTCHQNQSFYRIKGFWGISMCRQWMLLSVCSACFSASCCISNLNKKWHFCYHPRISFKAWNLISIIMYFSLRQVTHFISKENSLVQSVYKIFAIFLSLTRKVTQQ